MSDPVALGGDKTLNAETTNGVGTPTDATALSLTVTDPHGSIVTGFPVTLAAAQVIHDGTGTYHYVWTVPGNLDTGEYTANWAGVVNGAAISGTETFNVEAAGSLVTQPTSSILAYLTPGRYRAMALGIDLATKTDADLHSLIVSASAAINRYCAAPQGFDFRGGSIVSEEHVWDSGNDHVRGSGRLWPLCGAGVMPIDVSRIRIRITPTQYIDFLSTRNAVFTNPRLGYCEPVGSPATTGLFTAVLPWQMSSPVAEIDYTYGRTFSIVDEVLYPAADLKTYRSVNQFWKTAGTVKKNGTVVSSGFTINQTEGTVIFGSANTSGDVVSVSYTYTLEPEIALATGIMVTDLLGYSNINASGLTGLSGIRVEEIELKQAVHNSFSTYDLHPAAKALLSGRVFASWG
jgi:hypothetical protein